MLGENINEKGFLEQKSEPKSLARPSNFRKRNYETWKKKRKKKSFSHVQNFIKFSSNKAVNET